MIWDKMSCINGCMIKSNIVISLVPYLTSLGSFCLISTKAQAVWCLIINWLISMSTETMMSIDDNMQNETAWALVLMIILLWFRIRFKNEHYVHQKWFSHCNFSHKEIRFDILNEVSYARHYNPLLIWNCSWILSVNKIRILQKKLFKRRF